MRNRLILISILLLSASAFAQTTTITGTIKDLTGAVVTSGKVVFTLKPSVDTTISGNARFTPGAPITCYIQSGGTLLNAAQTGACVVTTNTSLTPAGTSYRVDICPYMACASSFNFYAINSSYDISTIVPTPTTGPAQNFTDVFSNQTVGGNKTFTGNTVFQSASFTGITTGSIGNIQIADTELGADCGAKIAAACTNLGLLPGEVWITQACGTSITTPVNCGNYNSLQFMQAGTWNQSALITMGTGSSILGIPSSISEDVLTRPTPSVVLKQAASTNLTNMVLVAGENTELRDLEINGNNPTNASTVCVGVDDTNVTNQSRSHLHWDHLTVAQCGGDDVQLFSTTTANQAAVAEIDYSSFNRSLNGAGLSIRDTTDVHIHFSKFELNSGYGLKAMNSVFWLWDSDVSGNAAGQLYMGVDADSALSVSLTGGFNLVGNGFTATNQSSGSCGGHLCENTNSSVIVNGYNGTSCGVLGNGYIFDNTFNLPLSTDPGTIDAIRVYDSGNNEIFANKLDSGQSGNTFKYGIDIGNVAGGCTTEPSDLVSGNRYEGPFGTAPYLYHASTDSECNGIGNAPGCTKARVASCTTAASANAACSTTVTWGVPLADANYTAVCTLDNPSFPSFVTFTSSKAAASLVVTIENAPGSTSATSGTLNCFARHD